MTINLWQIISTTDLMSRGVLLVLLGMSIVCWAFVIYKRMLLLAKIKQLKQAITLLHNAKGMDDFLARVSVIQQTYAGELINLFLTDFKRVLKMYESQAASDKEWYLFQATINQRVDEAIAEEESLMPVLSTSAQAAPLIGLFGTVWGLIHAFMGIAEQRSADISAVAPGIAEALITTLGGLVVAIPALVMFSYLQRYMKSFEIELVNLADSCVWIMKSMISSREEIHGAFTQRPVQQAVRPE